MPATRIRSKSAALILIALLALSYTDHVSPATAAASAARYPQIVRLQGRHYSILISAGPTAAVYSISDSAGQLLVDNLTLSDLRTRRPDLYNQIAPALSPQATASISKEPMMIGDDR